VTEYRLVPQSIRVPAGELTISIHNYGRLTHNLSVTRGMRTTGSTQPIRPGQTAQLTVTLVRGKYFMSSTILSDRDLGIYGTITVTG
jgi:plastocyanin